MGAMDGGNSNSDVYPHEVTLGDFSLGKFEVTVAQFLEFIDETNYKTTAEQKGWSKIYVRGKWIDSIGLNWRNYAASERISADPKSIPVVHVSWTDADAYCKWLSQKTNETYRLPTEAEWEFAARSGDSSEKYSFSGSDSIAEVAWFDKNSGDSIHTIGKRKANNLEIHDMSGNVAEWCNDWYDKDYYKKSPKENPAGPEGPAKDSLKVLRGGGWASSAKVAKTVSRRALKPDIVGEVTGFRVCRVRK
jgi:formylglycine-generating enzyme required for sulfatase activity